MKKYIWLFYIAYFFYMVIGLSGCVSSPSFIVKKTALLDQIPEQGSHLVSIGNKDEFDPLTDKNFGMYIWLDNWQRKYKIKFQLISPKGDIFQEIIKNQIQDAAGYDSFYSVANFKTLALSRFPGEWTAKFYVDGELAGIKKFVVIERPEMIANINEFIAKFPYFKAGIAFDDLSKVDNPNKRYGITWSYGKGCIITKILQDSTFHDSPIKVHDIIVEVDNDKISSGDDLALKFRHPNNPDNIEIYFYRPSEKKYFTEYAKATRITIENTENIFMYNGIVDDFYAWLENKNDFVKRHPYFSKMTF